MKAVDTCVSEVVKRGLHDWVDAAELAYIVQLTLGKDDQNEIREMARHVVAALLENDLVKAGDVTYDGFKEWTVPTTEALDRIAREWKLLPKGPNLGEICWFANTDAGNRKAKASL